MDKRGNAFYGVGKRAKQQHTGLDFLGWSETRGGTPPQDCSSDPGGMRFCIWEFGMMMRSFGTCAAVFFFCLSPSKKMV